MRLPTYRNSVQDKEQALLQEFHSQVTIALTELFEKKTLYQSVTVDLSGLESQIGRITGDRPPSSVIPVVSGSAVPFSQTEVNKRAQQPFREWLREMREAVWEFDTEYFPKLPPPATQGSSWPVCFRVPTVKMACNHCDGVNPPHNSGYKGLDMSLPSIVVSKGKSKPAQIITFSFLCQNCKAEPIVYIVRRDGEKFTLAGRSLFPVVEVPKFLPAEEAKHFRSAVIADATGNTLAGIFYLRVLVERYMRRITKAQGRKTGDELGDLYSPFLNDEFPRSFKSLAKIYEELSAKIHDADPSVEQFYLSKKDIENHFSQLKLLPLKENGTPNGAKL